MLTDFQQRKLTHYFNVLDYNNNKIIQKGDFVAIAENLCLLWGIKPETDEFQSWVDKFTAQWFDFKSKTSGANEDRAELVEWLEFADKNIVNGSERYYASFVEEICNDIFDNFDEDRNGFISQKEFVDFFMGYRIEMKYSAKSFMKLDTNRDDKISKEELLAGIKVFFRSENEENPGNWLFGFWEE